MDVVLCMYRFIYTMSTLSLYVACTRCISTTLLHPTACEGDISGLLQFFYVCFSFSIEFDGNGKYINGNVDSGFMHGTAACLYIIINHLFIKLCISEVQCTSTCGSSWVYTVKFKLYASVQTQKHERMYINEEIMRHIDKKC